ncbi:MAG: hypothetical protein ACXADY_04365 [Candidatus Hodarchaeales archaeon]
MNEHGSEKDHDIGLKNKEKESEADYEGRKEDKSKLKNVTIRGIDSETYNQFSRKVRNLEMNLGEAITKMMSDIIIDLNDSLDHLPGLRARTTFRNYQLERLKISHYDRLKISRTDLEEAKAYLSFSHIDNLTFLPDVTRDIFTRYVRNVSHCGTVRIPSIFPKLVMYSKLQFCDEIKVYDVKEEDQISNKISVED